ncbi:MAG: phenylalanine--tRNA ligase subunit alpha, partial [Chloroflexota bacterium]
MVEQDIGVALERLERLREDTLRSIEQAPTGADLDAVKIQRTGRKSPITELSRSIGKLSESERPALGAAVSAARQEIEEALQAREAELAGEELRRLLESEKLDVTLPATPYPRGLANPLLATAREIIGILQQVGYTVYEGLEVEWERYNFDMLNFPPSHPARDLQDTYWISPG